VGQAVDQYRQVIDALVSKRRNVAAGSMVFRHECCGAQPEHVLRSAVERLTSNH
jgi:transposase-like protein